MKTFLKQAFALLIVTLSLSSCKKDEAEEVNNTINNTSWSVSVTVNGNTTTQNVFEFANDGAYFSWHPAAAASFTGTWTQSGSAVNFTFKETTAGGDFSWDNTGTLSSDGKTFTGTMQRRGGQGSGTFIGKKL